MEAGEPLIQPAFNPIGILGASIVSFPLFAVAAKIIAARR